jgi:hypothetical protein
MWAQGPEEGTKPADSKSKECVLSSVVSEIMTMVSDDADKSL